MHSGLWAQPQTDSVHYHYYKILQPTHSDDLLNAYLFFENQRSKAEVRQDTAAIIYNLHLLSMIQLDLGLLYEGEQSSVEILTLLDARHSLSNFYDDYLRVYYRLGRIYRQLKHEEQSKDYYQKALTYAQTKNDSIYILNNIGVLYKDRNSWSLALKYFQMAYAKNTTPYDTLQYARALNNLYYVEALNGHSTAIDSMRKAKALRLKLNDSKGLYSSYRDLATFFHTQGNSTEANTYANRAMQQAESINSLTFLKDAFALFIEIGDNKDLLNYKTLSDSIESIRLNQQNTYASLKYNVAKEREQYLATLLRQEREKAQKQLYQALAIIVAIISIFVVYILRQRYKKGKEQEVYNTETRISKKVHDEVANDVYKVMSKLQTTTPTTPEILDDLEGIYNKTRDISKENSLIALNGNFTETLDDLLLSYSDDHCNVITKNSSGIHWDGVDANKKRIIYRVLQELMTNMRKHSRATLAVVSFSQNGKKITVNYRDNGLGTRLQKQTGLQNAENRILAMNGSITFETEPQKGFKVMFTL